MARIKKYTRRRVKKRVKGGVRFEKPAGRPDTDYLKNVNIDINIKRGLVQSLLDRYKGLSNSITFLSDIDTHLVKFAFDTLHLEQKMCVTRDEWKRCTSNCGKILRDIINIELQSTAYILRTLSKSLLSSSVQPLLEIEILGELTGLWKDDSTKIMLKPLGQEQHGRLIMGFGPSASGKTYWAKSIIELFSQVDPMFPKTFLSIDGGIYRETSIIYQYIIQEAEKYCIAGLDNLVTAGFDPLHPSLFNTNKIKKEITHFLENQQIPISLYVPETLGDCAHIPFTTCTSKYQKFIDITRDHQWIGLVIWQHKTAGDCDYPDGYKCHGCTESGKEREKKEGKKYSNRAYEHSMDQGLTEFNHAPGGKYIIHNSGSRDQRTTIKDYSTFVKDSVKDVFISNQDKYNYSYGIMFPVD